PAQRQARHSDFSRRDALALEGMAGACEIRRVEEQYARGAAHSGRRLAISQRRLPIHRRPGGQRQGRNLFTDGQNNKIHKISLDGKVSEFVGDSKRANGQAFGPDGRLYAVASGEQKIVAYDIKKQGSPPAVIAEGIRGNDIVVARNGNIYVTEPNVPAPDQRNRRLIKPNGEKKVVDAGLRFANGVTLSPDQTLLYVADYRSHWVYSYQIQPDGPMAGMLQYKQQYYWLHVADTVDSSQADGMRVDRDGRLYVATRMGIQVCDQAGRVNAIIPTPNGRVSNLTFGGKNGDTLFATCVDKVYKRKLKVKGANAWDAPLKPAPPRL